MLTCGDPFIREIAWLSLRHVVHRKTGRARQAPSNSMLMQYLSGSMADRLGANVGDASSLWSRVRRATRTIRPHCNT
ncbi:hypothetical protein J437_LFUL004167 [Ladona fulva]|uniref:Uncharacterized protein n=1 Tax=Ladona fulva TaxID=123851 RepID=A0A8K0K0T9_LADFU|nr:hypothetical protein J437_LFUL004167 [Ladona fulva]